jgi:hypothetical protein
LARDVPVRGQGHSQLSQPAGNASLSPTQSLKVEHDAFKPRPNILLMETKLGTHLQHSRVFCQHIAIDTPQAFLFRVAAISISIRGIQI